MQHAVRTFIWFLSTIVRGTGAGLFWSAALCLLTLMVISFRRSPYRTRRRFWWLAVLPLTWTGVGLWGGYFWVDPSNAYVPHPAWVDWPVQYGLWIFLVVSAVLVFSMRRGRTFAVLFAIANLYLMLGMTLLALMAISGVWL